MKANRRSILVSFLVACLSAATQLSCEREDRSFEVPPTSADSPETVPVNVSIRPGGTGEAQSITNPRIQLARLVREPYGKQYLNNAQAQSDGQTLYESFNCVGCHAHGGGGIGPPLLDNKWFYGSEPEQVYQSIVSGRPNGMPSFRGRITDYQVWELVAYVRSLSGQASPNAASGREDHMKTQPAPNSTTRESPEMAPEPTTQPAGAGHG